MFRKRTKLNLLGGLALAGAIAVVAVPTATAAPANNQACQTAPNAAVASPYPGWVFVTDDNGVPYLYPSDSGPARNIQSCTSASPLAPAPNAEQATGQPSPAMLPSPYAGWVFVPDDLGIPWLVRVAG